MCWYNTSRFWPYKWQVCVSKTSWHVIVTWLHFHAEQEHLKSFIWYEAQRQSLTRPAEAVWDTHWLRLGCVSLGARQMDGAEELISLAFWKECVMGQCQALWPTTFTCPFCHPKPALSELLSAPLFRKTARARAGHTLTHILVILIRPWQKKNLSSKSGRERKKTLPEVAYKSHWNADTANQIAEENGRVGGAGVQQWWC